MVDLTLKELTGYGDVNVLEADSLEEPQKMYSRDGFNYFEQTGEENLPTLFLLFCVSSQHIPFHC